MIDKEGYRYNIGMIIANKHHKILLAKRVGQEAWQLPQGGIDPHEKVIDALFRELYEEVGLNQQDVEIIGHTKRWLRYQVPQHLARKNMPYCIGQQQRWYLLNFIGEDSQINLTVAHKPEFDSWQWVNYWYPLQKVIYFKRRVYRQALQELAPLFWQNTRGCNMYNTLDNITK